MSSTTMQSSGGPRDLVVRPLFEGDLDRADRIYRTALYTKFSEVASHYRTSATSATSEVRELTSAVFDGLDVTRELDAVLDQKLGETVGASVISAGVNLGRERAYAALRQGGFRNEYQGVSMHRPNEPAYDRHNCYVIDDWR